MASWYESDQAGQLALAGWEGVMAEAGYADALNPFNLHVELTLTDLGRPQTILAPPAAQVAAIGI